MAQQSRALVEVLKSELKRKNLTYIDVANALDLSEASIKQMFANCRFTLERLEHICGLMNYELVHLLRLYEESRERLMCLTQAQEQELVSDIKLLLVAVLVRNHWTFDEILANYNLTEHEAIQSLAKLDRIGIIELLPANRIKLLIDEGFRWLPAGPIASYFENEVQAEFLSSHFDAKHGLRLFLTGTLSQASYEFVNKKIGELERYFTDLYKQDSKLAASQRLSRGLLIAFRDWEFAPFRKLRREK
ncbi:MAG: XRE family transcriptional regulator [Gammaproteobacteria bacterium]|nr:XRE family transcriptional regulator [Gammaproteobacteria bacterium]MDH5730976.1 XRE family transcriptional regulator [Gammaproteobacteria bacterium]